MRCGIARHAVSLLVLVAACGASAQEAAAPDALTGTLAKIRDSGQIVLGYRRDALPFSYLDRHGEPAGYAIDLCQEIAADIATALDQADLRTVLRPVTTADQFTRLTEGSIDLDCGATTNTVERRRIVAFSPTIFVSGARLLVDRSSAIRSFSDLAGHTVVATAGSTTAAELLRYIALRKLDARLVTEPDATRSFQRLASGEADAFATNDVLLYSLIATAEGGHDFHVVGGPLTYDPYAIAYRRGDPGFAAMVDATFARLAAQGLLTTFYDRWFARRLPTGERLDVPMSPQLQAVFHGLGEPG
jgi:glutamate/aspartate transport system substrate-binding protein